MELVRGHLEDGSAAPDSGEAFLPLVMTGGVRIEQILSGVTESASYAQSHDEWVIVLAGGASLEVGDAPESRELVDLGPRDWVLLPANVAHRVVQTEPGTSWLAVHVEASGGS